MKYFVNKVFALLGLSIVPIFAFAQKDSVWKALPIIQLSGFVDVFYTYDFNQPQTNYRQSFFYSYNRHNEFNLNLGYIKLSAEHPKYRVNFALQAGTYANDNYASEPGLLKNIFEANAGISLNRKNNLWLDAGIFASHIGFESAVSLDSWTLTRSILAENSPYYLSGAKLTFVPNDKWELASLICNGWQHIQKVRGNSLPAFGTQVKFSPNQKVMLNWTADASAPPAPAKAPSRRVTDAPTRMFHWLFALCFAGAYATADGEHWRLLHVTLGYTMAGLLGFRLLYGIFGPRTSGLGLLWRKLAGAPAWLRTLPQASSVTQINWRQGQNLLMVLAIVLLLALVVPLTLSGYATYNDWGAALGGNWMGEAMEEVHEFFGNALLLVVLAHIALIAGLSVLRRKNQALPMLTGRVEGKGPDLVNKNRTWLAALLLIATLAFGAWQWQQSPGGWVASSTSTERQRHHDDD